GQVEFVQIVADPPPFCRFRVEFVQALEQLSRASPVRHRVLGLRCQSGPPFAHADSSVPRRLYRTMETRSSGPTLASTSPASAVRTVQAKVSRAGRRPSAVSTETETRIPSGVSSNSRSEEHTSELQSRFDLVCRL